MPSASGMWRRTSGCTKRRSLTTRIRDWWDLRWHRYDRMFARLDALGLGPDDLLSGAGVREPRRPLNPQRSSGIALDLPED
jgi:hypothetical protein